MLSSPWKERRGLGGPKSLVGFKPPAGRARGQDREMSAAPRASSHLPKASELWGRAWPWTGAAARGGGAMLGSVSDAPLTKCHLLVTLYFLASPVLRDPSARRAVGVSSCVRAALTPVLVLGSPSFGAGSSSSRPGDGEAPCSALCLQ